MEERLDSKALEILISYVARGEMRTDVLSLVVSENAIFQRNQSGEESDIDETARNLFWDFYSPTRIASSEGEKNKTVPALSKDELELVMETLEKLETATRVPYEPDVEENYDKLLIYLHIAACRALLLKKRDGYSDDVRQTLEESWHAMRRFLGGEALPFDVDEMKDDWARSSVATTALILVELFRVRRNDGNYEEALHLFALALGYASDAIFAAFGEEPVEFWRLKYERYIPRIDVDAQEAADIFENLRASARTRDWRQIAADCRMINLSWGDCLGSHEEFRSPEEVVTDREGREWEWISFWEHARGWAEAKLEPSELLEEMKKAEDEKAQQRLTVYFFGDDLWGELSERAKKSLIEAERVWFSTRVGRVGGILNELRIATEEILYSLFWVPLSQRMDSERITDTRLLDFQKIREDLSQRGHKPSLPWFESMLKTYAFKEFFDSLSVSKEDRDFTLRELPPRLKNLQSIRRSAEHDFGRIQNMKEVAPLFKEFLGIGCKGILPRLVEIKRKVANSKAKRG